MAFYTLLFKRSSAQFFALCCLFGLWGGRLSGQCFTISALTVAYDQNCQVFLNIVVSPNPPMSMPGDDWDYYLLNSLNLQVGAHENDPGSPGSNEEGINDSFQIMSSGMYSIRVVNTDRNCSVTSGQISVTVPNKTKPNLSASPSDTINCNTPTITLTATAPQGQGLTIFSYKWLRNNAVIPGQTGTLTVTTAGSYKVRVVYENNGPCEVDSDPTTISIVDQLSAIAIVAPPSSVCPGQTVTLSTANIPGAAALSWSTGAATASITVNPTSTTTYMVTVTKDTCSKIVSTTVNVSEKPDISALSRTFSVTTGNNLEVNLGQAGAMNLTTASWVRQETINIASGAPPTLSGASPNLTPQLEEEEQLGGIRYAVVPKNDGCIGDTFLVTIKVLPIIEDGIYVPEVLSPNGDGVNDLWEVVVPDDPETYTVMMYNRAGGKVYENTLATAWDASGCPDGVYYYKITKEGELIKQGALTIIGKNQ